MSCYTSLNGSLTIHLQQHTVGSVAIVIVMLAVGCVWLTPKQTQNKCEGSKGNVLKGLYKKSEESQWKPMRPITWELDADTHSVWQIWGTHAEDFVNTLEHKWIHDMQSEEQGNTIETPADKNPNQESFSYWIEAWNSKGNNNLH
jgi:hypothetical protein